MSCMVANPEDRFSHDEAHFLLDNHHSCDTVLSLVDIDSGVSE